jgi:hypothetical protein
MPKKVPISSAAAELTTRMASAILQIEMKKQGISYGDLARRLRLFEIEDNEANVRNKIGRGTFSAWFFLGCLLVMGCKKIDLEWTVDEYSKLVSGELEDELQGRPPRERRGSYAEYLLRKSKEQG